MNTLTKTSETANTTTKSEPASEGVAMPSASGASPDIDPWNESWPVPDACVQVVGGEEAFDASLANEPRAESEIAKEARKLSAQLWYHSAKVRALRNEVQKGETTQDQLMKYCGDSRWIDFDHVSPAARDRAREAEALLGEGNYGIFANFELGVLNGKLAALRWACGVEWDKAASLEAEPCPSLSA